ncbi:hypothetical protein [uncultured Thermanaerothrix sp.]|uniref:hypothetical protein n=1 Tax=uncultured Thermanaerothrix sp. TaxID=1195149 RepID=UPI002605B96F|nr:hypothetical protein [uncultured Thermanaerothrix sp.]
MRTKPLMLLTFLLLLLLGSTGIAYALWSEVLTVEGTVYTGEVYGKWDLCFCLDRGKDPLPNPWPYPYPKPVRKNVGNTICTIDSQDPRIAYLTVNNGYPSYYNVCDFKYINAGSVPVIIRGIKIAPDNFSVATQNGSGDGEIWIAAIDGVGSQLEPGDKKSLNVEFHVEQPAKENFTYNFKVLVCIAQWNETATLDQCLAAAPKY